RCLKLGTTDAPLRFRLVDQDTQKPIEASLRVTVSPTDSDSNPATTEPFSVQNAQVHTAKQYKNVAFVRVYNRDSPVAYIPVEIFNESLLTFPIHVDKQKADLGDLLFQRGRWIKQLYDRLRVMGEFRKDLNALLEKKKHDEALKKAEDGLQ